MIRYPVLFFLLYLFWLLLSGIPDPFLVGAGAGSALAVTFMARHLNVAGTRVHPNHIIHWRFFSYWPWLIKEVVFSALDVSKRILNPRLPISPTLVEFVPSQKTELGLVIHANSITLTPGTISIEVSPKRFLIHALTQEAAAGLSGSEMDRRCALLEMK